MKNFTLLNIPSPKSHNLLTEQVSERKPGLTVIIRLPTIHYIIAVISLVSVYIKKNNNKDGCFLANYLHLSLKVLLILITCPVYICSCFSKMIDTPEWTWTWILPRTISIYTVSWELYWPPDAWSQQPTQGGETSLWLRSLGACANSSINPVGSTYLLGIHLVPLFLRSPIHRLLQFISSLLQIILSKFTMNMLCTVSFQLKDEGPVLRQNA